MRFGTELSGKTSVFRFIKVSFKLGLCIDNITNYRQKKSIYYTFCKFIAVSFFVCRAGKTSMFPMF